MRKSIVLYLVLQIGYCLRLQAQVNLLTDAYSIVQESTTEIVCTSLTNGVRKEKRVITLLNAKGKDEANFVCFCDKFSSLRKFSGEVQGAGGNTLRKIKKSELQVSEYSSGLVSDDYMYYFEYTPSQYPITVVYEWEVKYNDGLIGYPSFVPQRSYYQSVAKASYSIQTPADNPCRYQVVRTDAVVKQQQTTDGNWLTEVSIESLPAIRQEPFSPSLADILPRIYFSPTHFSFEKTAGKMESWQTYGEWQYRLLEGRDQLPPALKQELQKITAHCQTPYEQVKAVYQYLGANTRYVSMQLGIGGLQPIPATEVYRTGFGDCKGLSNYTRAMLAELGIPSYYTVISTTNKHLLKEFASANQMNHVILQVPLPNDTLWLECTNPELPLGYVHQSIAGNDALLIGPNGGTLCQLPTYPDSLNTQVNRAAIALSADGRAHVKVQQSSRLFQYEDQVSLVDLTAAKQKEWIRSDLHLAQANMDDIQLKESKQTTPQLDLTYSINCERYGDKTGKRLFVPINIFHKNFSVPSQQEARKQPVQINYGYLDIDSICIQLPDTYEVESLPQTIELKSQFGEFQASLQSKDKTLFITQRLLLYQGSYPKESYSEFVIFRKAIASQYRSKIILKRIEE